MCFVCVWFLTLQFSEQAMGTVGGRILAQEHYVFLSTMDTENLLDYTDPYSKSQSH